MTRGQEDAGLRMPLGSPLLNTLGRMNIGGVLLDAGGGVVDINEPARRLLNGKSNGPGTLFESCCGVAPADIARAKSVHSARGPAQPGHAPDRARGLTGRGPL